MTGWRDLILLRPGWLLLVAAIAFAAFLIRRRATQPGDWARVADAELLAAMATIGRVRAHGAGIGIKRIGMRDTALVAAAVIALALTGPAMERRTTDTFRNLDGVILVMDVSPSMLAADTWIQHVAAARTALSALGSKPAALIIFAGDAYRGAALTAERQQIGYTIALIDAETVPDPGSRPERGLAMAAAQLQTAGIVAGDVVLFSDGGGIGPAAIAAADRIADTGATLHVVGDPNAASGLSTLARIASGRVYSPTEIDALAQELAKTGRERMAVNDQARLFWKDYGRFLLILALFPVAQLCRRGAI